ncbi:exopolyphosphatase/guanosine-5'-triphosphate,3'-diphosphate pyrophosphatase [Thermovibrio guaymasensis]|uniref:Exopolyphosphatase/guanosine-5'-triphosphate, 3'-diphosphate pyrophosphatase n=1 Tax=Thermovibrio guaymasensis TaxID=240167 RepID=A0A420W7Z5_9BACT|nr:Ppx/GppA phosphatase family protein [Thermovibrio guaymasensis]RKQ63419.1 exopolyphosphatase/guanosine-5'-triphosphate,3'-diphosphate pyrophosphatase [Thermovibrio guaymasensis]
MRIATIDVGTNSTRILVADVEDGEVRPLFKTGKVTRLGRGVKETGRLSKEGIEATVGALKEFKAIVERFNVEKVVVVTTEAARRAENAEEFLNRVRELGFKIDVLSDRDEAELVFLANLKVFKPKGKAMTVDLGGGSTEVVYGNETSVEFLKSLKFGVVFLYEEFGEDLVKLEEFIRGELLKVKEEIEPSQDFTVFAVGGTITSVVAMEEKMEVYKPEVVHGYRVTKHLIDKWYKHLSSLPIEERKKVVGLEENRADVIIPGLAFFKVFCEVFSKESLTVSEVGLLYGLALREALNG